MRLSPLQYTAPDSRPFPHTTPCPPAAWGGNVVTLPQVQDYAAYTQQQGGAGIMLWSLHKKGTPSAQSVLTQACTTLGMPDCSAAIPM